MSAWTTHRPTFGQEAPQNPHQVPFRPVQAVPGALGFGFGAGPSNYTGPSMSPTLSSNGGGVAFATPRPTASLQPGFGMASGGGLAVAPNARRRRRSASPSEQEMGREAVFEGGSNDGSPVRRVTRAIKKMRGTGEGSPRRSGQAAKGGAAEEVDTGKMLTHLSKSELLTILNSLMAADSSLVPKVQQLLPAPSLDRFASRLAAMESAVMNALPQRTAGVVMRDEYIWGRVKVPVEEYVSEARTWVTAFCPPSTAESTGSQQHPSTVFTFLSNLTASVLRLESVLPRVPLPAFSNASTLPTIAGLPLNPLDPLASSLVPHLLNRWHCLITRVNHEVNVEGRMFGHDLIRGWLRTLDSLPIRPQNSTGSICSVAMDGVKGRIVQELGWMAGIKPAPASAMDVRMGDEEEI